MHHPWVVLVCCPHNKGSILRDGRRIFRTGAEINDGIWGMRRRRRRRREGRGGIDGWMRLSSRVDDVLRTSRSRVYTEGAKSNNDILLATQVSTQAPSNFGDTILKVADCVDIRYRGTWSSPEKHVTQSKTKPAKQESAISQYSGSMCLWASRCSISECIYIKAKRTKNPYTDKYFVYFAM
ncbi:hypothetical protein EJ05DRAFT_482878 [Pseudovirgaria hyperparasitica]|uniref:Uncharacterized protein n=1 Tax=Pseudovirgaria hyperparasitica TaxID=470096 RepID=A0A6A6WJ05_9PEZI|nr:uncharacterized protein EJ05DRAFT_482878 [Pseudovirgaria hyperparasitica]KAF2762090.1 hypothetical protein EJ05DRAFT_482878 [Pseudovirgaria hyperparasitica]